MFSVHAPLSCVAFFFAMYHLREGVEMNCPCGLCCSTSTSYSLNGCRWGLYFVYFGRVKLQMQGGVRDTRLAPLPKKMGLPDHPPAPMQTWQKIWRMWLILGRCGAHHACHMAPRLQCWPHLGAPRRILQLPWVIAKQGRRRITSQTAASLAL